MHFLSEMLENYVRDFYDIEENEIPKKKLWDLAKRIQIEVQTIINEESD